MIGIKKITLLGVVAISSVVFAYEPSVYGAGNIDSDSPYGLTPTEQAVVDNKKTLQMLYNKMTEQQRRIDGLTTILEGQNREILELKEQLEAQSSIAAKNSAADQNKTYSLLMQLSQNIDFISSTYVTKEEISSLLGGSSISSNSNTAAPMNNNVGAPVGNNSAASYRRGVQLFGQGSYGAAKDHFEQALAQNYKSAPSHYYLGEIAYYTKNYQDAVSHYKQSASVSDDASYMDVLFLHTAIALDRTGEREQARSFYQHVIDNYPNKKAAAIARKRL
jgi:TolA-binding protein